ncbi:hypothetical protein V8G54_005522 [Vigna mungo]|uniref:Uncharacterized protein n=1 Tax=Vigna mungo TaxID=3915 RepID=A0AAQ3NYF7_VIGMU
MLELLELNSTVDCSERLPEDSAIGFAFPSSPSTTFRSKSSQSCLGLEVSMFVSERFLSLSQYLRGDAGRKALVAADPFQPSVPSNCKGTPGNPGVGVGLEAETTGMGVDVVFTQTSISSEPTSLRSKPQGCFSELPPES